MGSNAADLARRAVVSVDVDNFDRVLSSMAPRLQLPVGSSTATATTIEFRQLDDFHPDRLYRDLHFFAALRERCCAGIGAKSLASGAPDTVPVNHSAATLCRAASKGHSGGRPPDHEPDARLSGGRWLSSTGDASREGGLSEVSAGTESAANCSA